LCGRFSFAVQARIIEQRFKVEVDSTFFSLRYNCAPSQRLAVISNAEPEQLSYYRWGLIPVWAKEISIGAKMINAKAETISEKPSFSGPFKRRRCLVPADSFYEWQKDTLKTPYRILMKDEQPFAMAGIWDAWVNERGEEIRSFAILTTTANELIAPIHHRMPVILSREKEQQWIEERDAGNLQSLLVPYDAGQMKTIRISRLVNITSNNRADIWSPI
jgi:putative SOS response-associated peptidase YedK